MSEKHSLIDVNEAGEVANNLINKISQCIGWIVTHDTPKKIAVNYFVEEIKKSNLPPLEKAAFISSANKIIKEYKNQNNIIALATSMLENDARPDKINDDWIDDFMDKAKGVSDEEFRTLWARVLAGEANRPGSFSVRTLSTLKNLSKDEAECFVNAVKRVAYNKYRPFLFRIDNLVMDISAEAMILLDECGLVANTSFLQMSITLKPQDKTEIFHNHNYIVIARNKSSEKDIKITMGIYELTRIGRELLSIVAVDDEDDSMLYMAQELNEKYEDVEINAYHIICISGENIVHEEEPYHFNILTATM